MAFGDKLQSFGDNAGAGSALGLVLPGNTTPGKLVVICAGTNDSTGAGDDTIDTPSGWARVDAIGGITTLDVAVFYREADGTTLSTSLTSAGGANGGNRQGAMVEYDVEHAEVVATSAAAKTTGSAAVSLQTSGITPSESQALVIATLILANSAGGDPPFSLTNSFVADQIFQPSTPTSSRGVVARKVVTDESTQDTTFSWTTARNAEAVITTFDVAAAVPGFLGRETVIDFDTRRVTVRSGA